MRRESVVALDAAPRVGSRVLRYAGGVHTLRVFAILRLPCCAFCSAQKRRGALYVTGAVCRASEVGKE